MINGVPHGAEGRTQDTLTGKWCRGCFEATAIVERLAAYEDREEAGRERDEEMKYCCNECKNKDCAANYKNAKKGERLEFAPLCGSRACKGYKRP